MEMGKGYGYTKQSIGRDGIARGKAPMWNVHLLISLKSRRSHVEYWVP